MAAWITTPAALAQDEEPEALQDVVLSIYPEYDNLADLPYPTVLVMIEGQISGAEPPANIRFLVPTNGTMYSAGSGPRSQYVGGPPDRQASGMAGWDEISYTLQTDSFVVEYYVPIPPANQKAFSSIFQPLYPIDGLVTVVKQPLESSNFAAFPNLPPTDQQQFTDSQGYNTQQYMFEGIEKNQSLSFTIQYADCASSSNTGMIIGIAVGGCLVLATLGFWLWRRSGSQNTRIRLQRGQALTPAPESKKSGARFCSQCGTKLTRNSRFCPDCGAKLRQ